MLNKINFRKYGFKIGYHWKDTPEWYRSIHAYALRALFAVCKIIHCSAYRSVEKIIKIVKVFLPNLEIDELKIKREMLCIQSGSFNCLNDDFGQFRYSVTVYSSCGKALYKDSFGFVRKKEDLLKMLLRYEFNDPRLISAIEEDFYKIEEDNIPDYMVLYDNAKREYLQLFTPQTYFCKKKREHYYDSSSDREIVDRTRYAPRVCVLCSDKNERFKWYNEKRMNEYCLTEMSLHFEHANDLLSQLI